jgi:hypothetical protein
MANWVIIGFHAAARLARSGCRQRLKISVIWAWATTIAVAL